MANEYGMVPTMKRTYRRYESAVNAGRRRARSTGKPAYVGMLRDLHFHISDEDPRTDWRWEAHVICLPDGTVQVPKGLMR